MPPEALYWGGGEKVFYIILEWFWYHFGMILISFWDDFGIILGWCWHHFATLFLHQVTPQWSKLDFNTRSLHQISRRIICWYSQALKINMLMSFLCFIVFYGIFYLKVLTRNQIICNNNSWKLNFVEIAKIINSLIYLV